jgi:ribonuclease HI
MEGSGRMIRIFTDGAAQPNPGSMGIGVVIEWQGKKPTIYSEYIGEGTNNEAEYGALLQALQMIKDENIKIAKIHSDSNLMVNQVNGNWKAKDIVMQSLRGKAQKRIDWLIQKGFQIELVYIPRTLNVADEPAKRGAEKGKAMKFK